MTINQIKWDKPLSIACQNGALTIGNFDGVHRGHQALLRELRTQADAQDMPTVVLTFDPHPLQLLRPQHFPPLLTTMPQRAELLQSHGADFVLILQTTPDLLRLRARDFFDRVLVEKIQPKTIVPGFNFAFGHNREGTVETLAEFCRDAEIGFVSVPPAFYNDETISSSRVRAALQAGQVRLAAQLLGRPYALIGTVGVGQKRGRTIGFPTANLEAIQTMPPANGVYAVRANWEGKAMAGAANIGPNPTFGEDVRKIEVHLLDFEGDLYGSELKVEFIERLRDTKAFAGVEELKRQLQQDIAQVRKLEFTL